MASITHLESVCQARCGTDFAPIQSATGVGGPSGYRPDLFVRDGEVISPPSELTPEMEQQAGVFVSLHKKGALRGCIGTIEPAQPNVAQEIVQNAISAATRDPRFPPVRSDELDDLLSRILRL